ncbi:MAG: hypothetical protein LWX83_07925 [Anaerolineae bacterium]|nr:hypothetical protein [Anaerolineae bacterium]
MKKNSINPLQIVVILIILIVVAMNQNLSSLFLNDGENQPGVSVTSTLTAAAGAQQSTSSASKNDAEKTDKTPESGMNDTLPADPSTNGVDTSTNGVDTSTNGVDISALADFDYFVLALSWSPDYCATSGDPQEAQCQIGKKLGFVLHGLWPEYEKGYPSDCNNDKLTANVKKEFAVLYPSTDLISHEWQKHGTCSGLEPADYFNLSKKLYQSVNIPADYRNVKTAFRTDTANLKTQFVETNVNFSENSLAVFCSSSGRFLKEIYVCFSKDGLPRACSQDIYKNAGKSCQKNDFLVRNFR